jgi:hypothetical protein
MDDDEFKRVVKQLAELQRTDQQSMDFEAFRHVANVDENQCWVIIGRLKALGHVQVTAGVRQKIVVLASIIDFANQLSKPKDLRAELLGVLNSKWWWAYPSLLVVLALTLFGLVKAYETARDLLLPRQAVQQQQALPEPAKQLNPPAP